MVLCPVVWVAIFVQCFIEYDVSVLNMVLAVVVALSCLSSRS